VLQLTGKVAELVEDLGLKSILNEYNVPQTPQTDEEAKAMVNTVLVRKKGPDYDAIIEMAIYMY